MKPWLRKLNNGSRRIFTTLNSVLNADMWVGKWLDAVLEVSDGEEWLLIVVSDHGVKPPK